MSSGSSSSFILAFDKENTWEDFENYCKEFNLMSFLKLVEHFRERTDLPTKDGLKVMMRSANRDVQKFAEELVDKYYPKLDDIEKVFKISDIIIEKNCSNKCIEEFKEMLRSSGFSEKETNLDSCDEFVFGEVYDIYDGVLNYALRNGLVKEKFCKWQVYSWNNG